MAGDHGLSPVFYYINPEVEVLEKLQSDLGKQLIVKKISSDEGEGHKLTHNLNFPNGARNMNGESCQALRHVLIQWFSWRICMMKTVPER